MTPVAIDPSITKHVRVLVIADKMPSGLKIKNRVNVFLFNVSLTTWVEYEEESDDENDGDEISEENKDESKSDEISTRKYG